MPVLPISPGWGHYFVGHIAAIQIDGKLYRFATYNGAKFKSRLEDDALYLEFKKGNYCLSIKSVKGIGAELKSPISGKMTGKVNESLQATMDVLMTDKGKALVQVHGNNAGLEVAGDINILLKDKF